MKNKGLFVIAAATFVFAFTLAAHAETVDEIFKKTYPNIQYDTLTPTDIKGIYEITAGTNIAYFAPDPGYLIVGDIRDKNGVSITNRRKNEIMAAKAKNLPLEKAVKIGNGKSTVIEFTDPDCPYCRKASEFFAKRTDVTRYVFFFPLPMHPDAENKAAYVVCAKDKAKAYEEAMTGKLDDQKYAQCKKPEAAATINSYKQAAEKLGVNSTPFFIVNGKAISGADIPRLEEALKTAQ